MKHLILGTAGHIDHGKTSLVKALTGFDTDRLKEEKARGITIELGFAHLDMPGDIRLGIVDVPGHEKFVRTMVAGVAGMDIVMLVIAADGGIMPQTREHLDILRLLGVKRGLIALTKCDLVDREWLDLAIEEVHDFTFGSFLEGTPVVPVSTLSGEGLQELKRELASLAETAVEKRREGPFRLPVDRVFTVPGFGTVVTGTLLSGEIRVGDEFELLPGALEGKVRGVQTHGVMMERGYGGQRVAVNLQGIDLEQVKRGDQLAPRSQFSPSSLVDARLDLLASSPRDIKHRAIVRLHSATFEVSAQVIMLEHRLLRPGESGYVQLRLKSPVLLLPGDSFIIRVYSPSVTIAGGEVLDPSPPRRRRSNDEALRLLEHLCKGEDQQSIVTMLVSQSLLSGITFDDILFRSGIERSALETILAGLLNSDKIFQMTREPRIFLVRSSVESLKKSLINELISYMAAHPLKEGIAKEELKSKIPNRSDRRFFAELLALLERDAFVALDREIVKPADRISVTSPANNGMAENISAFLNEKGIEPPTIREITERFLCSEKSVRDNLALLVRKGHAVRISSDLYYASAVLELLREKLLICLREKGEIIPSDYREVTGLSRKFLIPLLEHFDSEKITIRVGDRRLLRKA
jgi:selenocysteine-specific elongation factor